MTTAHLFHPFTFPRASSFCLRILAFVLEPHATRKTWPAANIHLRGSPHEHVTPHRCANETGDHLLDVSSSVCLSGPDLVLCVRVRDKKTCRSLFFVTSTIKSHARNLEFSRVHVAVFVRCPAKCRLTGVRVCVSICSDVSLSLCLCVTESVGVVKNNTDANSFDALSLQTLICCFFPRLSEGFKNSSGHWYGQRHVDGTVFDFTGAHPFWHKLFCCANSE